MIANPQSEMMGRSERRAMVERQFLRTFRWAYEKSPFYRQKFSQANISIDDVKSLDDIGRLPLTTLAEIKQTAASDLMTGPMSNALRLTQSPNGLYRCFTADDMARNIDIALRPLAANDINKASTLLICGDYSMQYRLDLHYAAEALGAAVLPCRGTDAVLNAINIFHPSTLIASAEALTEIAAGKTAMPPKLIALVTTLHDERIPALAKELKQDISQIYVGVNSGLAGIFFTCEHHRWHIQEDYFYPEIVDGNLVLTALAYEAMPILRFVTDQHIKLCSDKICPCGRTFATVADKF